MNWVFISYTRFKNILNGLRIFYTRFKTYRTWILQVKNYFGVVVVLRTFYTRKAFLQIKNYFGVSGLRII